MTEETNTPETPEVHETATSAEATESTATATETAEATVKETSQPQYAPVTDTSTPNPDRSMNRFLI